MSPMDGPSFVSPNTSIEQNIEEAKVLEPEKLFSNLDVNNGLSIIASKVSQTISVTKT